MRRFLGFVLLLLITAPLGAAPVCTAPDRIATPRAVGPTADEPARQAVVTGYTLALSWSPEYCQRNGRRPEARLQCTGPLARRFVLHGLWPDAADPKAWPQYCRPAAILPEAVLRANLCTTPSAQLLQHEWAKHGSCMTNRPDAYFAAARSAFEALRFPAMGRLANDRALSVGALQRAFAGANRGVPPSAFRVRLNRKGWLEEVHVCFDRARRPTACPAGADGALAGTRVRIESGAREPRPSRSRGDAYRGARG